MLKAEKKNRITAGISTRASSADMAKIANLLNVAVIVMVVPMEWSIALNYRKEVKQIVVIMAREITTKANNIKRQNSPQLLYCADYVTVKFCDLNDLEGCF